MLENGYFIKNINENMKIKYKINAQIFKDKFSYHKFNSFYNF